MISIQKTIDILLIVNKHRYLFALKFALRNLWAQIISQRKVQFEGMLCYLEWEANNNFEDDVRDECVVWYKNSQVEVMG